MPGVALPDYERAGLIVVWGCNPNASGIHLLPPIQAARKRGAKLIVVDPRRTRLAKAADLHVQLRPGTDLPVALSLLRWLFAHAADRAFLAEHATGAERLETAAAPWTFEHAAIEAGVAPATLEAFARLYAATSPAVIRCGWGPERNRNAGSAVAAILALPAVAGKFGVRAGGYTMSNSPAFRDVDPVAASAEPEAAHPPRAVNMNQLGRALTRLSAPPVQALFVYNCNPWATLPNQNEIRAGLLREDLFTVVFDAVWTDTALFADVVLPATTFLEHHELGRGYGALVLQRARPAVAPVDEARPNYEVFSALVHRLGLARSGDPEGPEALASALLASSPQGARLHRELEARGLADPACGPAPVQFVDVFPGTSDRKAHLFPDELDRAAPAGLYGYLPDPATADQPLALISPAASHLVSSTFGQLDRTPARVELHPFDAAARGLVDGDPVRIWNALGEVRCQARVNPDLRPGVASLAKGLWSHHTQNGATVNALCPDSLTDLGGGACFNDARVQIGKA
jgi:anaerobic selenocysteine-containing dehydrogenase